MSKTINGPVKTAHPFRALVAQFSMMSNDNPGKDFLRAVLRSARQFSTATVDEAAVLCNMSRSSLIRACKDLGFESFGELRDAVAGDLNSEKIAGEVSSDALSAQVYHLISTFVSMDSMISREAVMSAVMLLKIARKVFFFDLAFSTMRLDLQRALLLDGKEVELARSMQDQEICVKNADIDTVIFLSTTEKFSVEHARMARKNQAVLIALLPAGIQAESLDADCFIRIPYTSQDDSYLLKEVFYQYLYSVYADQHNAESARN